MLVSCFNRWEQGDIEDMHAQDDQQHIGTQNLGPQGLRTWVALRTAPNATLFDILNLPVDYLALWEEAYEIGKVYKGILACFHYFIIHYCYLSVESGTPVGFFASIEYSNETVEAFQLLVTVLSKWVWHTNLFLKPCTVHICFYTWELNI